MEKRDDYLLALGSNQLIDNFEEQLVGRGLSDARVLAAMARVERHRFVVFSVT